MPVSTCVYCEQDQVSNLPTHCGGKSIVYSTTTPSSESGNYFSFSSPPSEFSRGVIIESCKCAIPFSTTSSAVSSRTSSSKRKIEDSTTFPAVIDSESTLSSSSVENSTVIVTSSYSSIEVGRQLKMTTVQNPCLNNSCSLFVIR